MKQFKAGSVGGTGAAINIELGWAPDYVKVFNYDDAGALAPTIEWFNGMTDGHGLKTLSIVDSGATGNASSAKITSNGISAYAGSSTPGSETSVGFTIGADTDVNVSAETIYYMAVRNS